MNKYIQQSEEKNLGKLPNWMDCNCLCHGFEADGNECPHCHPEKWDLVSDCCKSEFDPFGFSNDQGLWDEKCLKCGKLCDVHYQKLSTPPHKEHGEWEKEFDNKWNDIIRHNAGYHSKLWQFDKKETLKRINISIFSFIHSLLSQALAQRDDALIKKIKGMMKQVNDNSNIGEDTEFAYNQALYDILSHLQETVKECHITKNNHNHVEGGLCGLDCHEAGVKITKKIQETEGKV